MVEKFTWELGFKQNELDTQIRNKFYQLHNKIQGWLLILLVLVLCAGWKGGGWHRRRLMMKILAYTSNNIIQQKQRIGASRGGASEGSNAYR